MQDRIDKEVVVKAPIDRVWRAISDHEEFGEWFRVKLEGPFVVGEVSLGRMTIPGFEDLVWKSVTTAIEPERLLAFTWDPYEYEPYENEPGEAPQILVEFRLEPTDVGTRVRISESGYAALPDDERRLEVYRRNDEGWAEQTRNITAHVER